MATPYEALKYNENKVYPAAGYEVVSAKSATTTTTLAIGDSRAVSADTTAGAFSLSLPASPYNGMQYDVYDGAAAGSWQTNNLTIDGNGKTIALGGAAAAATITCSQRSGWITLRYDSTADIWIASPADASGGGAVTLNGVQTLTNKTLTAPVIGGGLTASGAAANTFAGSTGTFVTSTGANTLSGDVTIAAGKDIVYAAGDGVLDASLGTGVTKTTTGLNTIGGDLLMAAGKIIGTGTPQSLSGAGAVNVTTFATLFTSTGGGQALTLANGTQAGQIKFVVHVVDGGSGVITPTTATGFTTLTLTAVYDWGAMIWDGAAWRALAYGGTAAFA